MSMTFKILFMLLALTGNANADVNYEGNAIPLTHRMGIHWGTFPNMPTIEELASFQSWHEDENLPNLGGGFEVGTFRWQTTNQTTEMQHLALVSTEEMTADYVHLVVLRADGSSEVARSGVLVAQKDVTYPSRAFILPFKLAPGETVTLFLSIKSSYTRNLHYQIMSIAEAVKFDFHSSIFMGFYFGTMLFAAAIGIIIFFVTKSNIAFAHGFYCMVTLFSASIGFGYLQQLVSFNETISASKIERALIWIIFGSSCWFVREATNVKAWSRFFYGAQTLLMFVCGINALLSLSYQFSQFLSAQKEIMVPIGAVLGISTALWGWISGKSEHAKYVFIGLGPYFTFGVIWEMQFSSQIPAYVWAAYGVFGVQIFQNIFF